MPSAPVYACQFWKACHSSRSCSKACAPNLLTRLQSLSTPTTCPCFPASENWSWRGIIMFSISRYTRFKYHTSVSSVRVWVLPTCICKMHVHGKGIAKFRILILFINKEICGQFKNKQKRITDTFHEEQKWPSNFMYS